MDDIILISFIAFTLMLMLIGFFRRQNLLVIFSGIGFFLIGLFILQGVTYVSGSTFNDVNFTFTDQAYYTATWHSNYAIPIFIFLTLFGIMLIIVAALDWSKLGPNAHDRTHEDDDGGE